MSDYRHSPYRCVSNGLSLSTAVDAVPPGKWRRITNLEQRSQLQAFTTRRGTSPLGFGPFGAGPVHSIDNYFDEVVNSGALFVGSGTNLYLNNGTNPPVATGFSGKPMGMVEYRPNGTSITYLLVADSNKMVKANYAGAVYQLGISPPGAVPPFTPNGAPATSSADGAGNLNSSVGVGYDWRYTYYSSFLQSESNPSAIQAALTTVVNQSALVTPGASSTDPQVDTIRFWRRGGTLGDNWRLVGSQANTTATFTDNASDASIASAQTLSLTNDVPVTTVNSAGVAIYQQPLPHIWGPYGGNVIFGTGDPNRPGYVYWSNPGNPDGWSSINNVEVTQPADQLQNGFFWNGRTFVWSLSKLFEGFPAQVGTNQYVFYDTGHGHGLAAPWAFVAGADHPYVWSLGRDGTYEWPGAGVGYSITDADLWPVFNGLSTENVPALQIGNLSNPTNNPNFRMEYYDNELRLSYIGFDSTFHLLACDVNNQSKPWRHAYYPWKPTAIYTQIESQNNQLWYGTSNGNIYSETGFGNNDIVGSAVVPVTCNLRDGYRADQDPDRQNEYGNVVTDYNAGLANITLTALYDDGQTSTVIPGMLAAAIRLQTPLSLGDVYHRDLAIDFSWQTGAMTGNTQLFSYEVVSRVDVLPLTHFQASHSFQGLPGWSFPFDGYITMRNNQIVTVTINYDSGITITQTIPAGSISQKLAAYLQWSPMKGKISSLSLDSSTPFWFYSSESYINFQGWGVSQPIKVRLGEA